MSSNRERAEARRAKIQAKNAERLEKLKSNAESEGRVLSDNAPPAPPTPASSKSALVKNSGEDPEDVDLAALTSKEDASQDTKAAPTNPFVGVQTKQPQNVLLKRVWPSVHLVSMVALGIYACFFLEPSQSQSASLQFSGWASLSSKHPSTTPGLHELSTVPLFWFFTAIEVVLNTTRTMLDIKPQGSWILSLLSSAGGLPLPAPIPTLIQQGVLGLQLLSVVFADLSVLVMTISAVIVLSNNAIHHGWVSVPHVGL